jgi:hypothetical protein
VFRSSYGSRPLQEAVDDGICEAKGGRLTEMLLGISATVCCETLGFFGPPAQIDDRMDERLSVAGRRGHAAIGSCHFSSGSPVRMHRGNHWTTRGEV